MTKKELLEFLNGQEEVIGDQIVLIKDGKGYSLGQEVKLTKATLQEMLRNLAAHS